MTLSALDPGHVLKTAFSDSTGRLQVDSFVTSSGSSYQGTFTDKSGTATTTSAVVAAANTSRRYFIIQNLSTTIDIYINFTSVATAGGGSIKLAPGSGFEMENGFISTEAINVIAASSTAVFTAKEG